MCGIAIAIISSLMRFMHIKSVQPFFFFEGKHYICFWVQPFRPAALGWEPRHSRGRHALREARSFNKPNNISQTHPSGKKKVLTRGVCITAQFWDILGKIFRKLSTETRSCNCSCLNRVLSIHFNKKIGISNSVCL